MTDQPDLPTQNLPVPATVDRVELLRRRLRDNDARLRRALRNLDRAARELTPAAAVSRNPVQVVLGAFVVGLLVGFVTRTRSHPGG